MIGKALWFGGLAIIAALTATVQLDRQSAVSPALAGLTPQPARGFAQAQIVASAMRSGDADRALAEAKRLVERRPLPAETVRLLAQTQLAAGQADQGLLTIQIAAQRGWRDPVAQEALLRLALAADDRAEAARRYTALMIMKGTEDALLVQFGDALFAAGDDTASRALLEVLKGSERWHNAFLQRGARTIPPEAFVNLVERAVRGGTRFDCEVILASSRSLRTRSVIAGERMENLHANQC